VSVFAELYDNPKEDVAPVAITTTMSDAAGRVVYRAEETVEGFAFDPARRAYKYVATIPLSGVAAGEHVIRVSAASRTRGGVNVTREVPVTVRQDRAVAD
jgi:hypothetical protein